MGKKNKTHFKVGDIYSFKTSPLTKFSIQDTGRYACLKILTPDTRNNDAKKEIIYFVVFENIFNHPPLLIDLHNPLPLERKRFSYGETTAFERMSSKIIKKYAGGSTNENWECDLLEFTYIGNIPISPIDEIVRQNIKGFSALGYASSDAEGEWRWGNDKENLLLESEKQRIETLKEEQQKQERYDSRLKNLTWEQVENEIYFKRWVSTPPFPSIQFTEELRDIFKLTITELKNLGKKPKRVQVRSILKSTTIKITSLNYKHDVPIESEEREDIYEVFYDLTHLCRQSILIDEISDWHHPYW